MLKDFENLMLRYLLKDTVKQEFRDLIDVSLFDSVSHQITLLCVKDYFAGYKKAPSKIELLQYSKDKLEKDDNRDAIRDTLDIIGEVFAIETNKFEYAIDVLLEHAQYRRFKQAMKEHSVNLKDEPQKVYKAFKKDLEAIERMAQDDSISLVEKSPLLIEQGANFPVQDLTNILKTPFKGLNNTLGVGGYTSPDFVVFMGGSKAFKTGIALKFATGFLHAGISVAFIDGENGYLSIETRYMQSMLACTAKEIVEDIFEEDHPAAFKSVKKVYVAKRKYLSKNKGGDMVIVSYAPNTANMNDVYDDLQEYNEQFGFKPKVIIVDDPTHFNPTKGFKAKHENIEQVVKDIFVLNKRLDTLTISPAQVKGISLNKDKYTAEDIGEAYAIYKYATSVLGLNQTEHEKFADVMKLSVVGGRGGQDNIVASYLKLDKARMQVSEITSEQAEQILKDTSIEFGSGKKEDEDKTPKKRRSFKKVTDD